MTDTKTPTDDLQINLADATKAEENTSASSDTTGKNTQESFDLDLNINLPTIEKNDDWLKEEDQKNAEETAVPVEEKEIIASQTKQSGEGTAPSPLQIIPETEPQMPVEQKQLEEVLVEEMKPSSSIEEIFTGGKEDLAIDNIQKDMVIINELENHPSAGGLAEEAKIKTAPAPAETPNTFDLDAILSTTPPPPTKNLSTTERSPEMVGNIGGNEGMVVPQISTTTTHTEQKNEQSEIPSMTSTITTKPLTNPIPTILTPEPSSGPATIIGTNIPVLSGTQKKTSGIKVLLFVMLFVAFGFTTYFILKTMYPIEFANIFSKDNEAQMHAIEEVPQEITTEEMVETTTEEIIGTVEETTDVPETDMINNVFGELNDIGAEIAIPTEETTISKLTEYVNQGNDLLAKGKEINNNTVIKYGLYISRKSTDFLTKIANGEEISNLSGYFAQFDQYIGQLQEILGADTTTTTNINASSEPVTDENTTEKTAPTADIHASPPTE